MARIWMFIHAEGDTFGASFPDFPGATTVSDDLDTLFDKAAQMLAFHVEGMIDDGEALPRLRTYAEIMADPTLREERETTYAVGPLDMDLPGKAIRVNVTIEEHMLQRIDRAAQAAGESRSGFLVAAARARLANAAKAM